MVDNLPGICRVNRRELLGDEALAERSLPSVI
jgi:hypothetical protein